MRYTSMKNSFEFKNLFSVNFPINWNIFSVNFENPLVDYFCLMPTSQDGLKYYQWIVLSYRLILKSFGVKSQFKYSPAFNFLRFFFIFPNIQYVYKSARLLFLSRSSQGGTKRPTSFSKDFKSFFWRNSLVSSKKVICKLNPSKCLYNLLIVVPLFITNTIEKNFITKNEIKAIKILPRIC